MCHCSWGFFQAEKIKLHKKEILNIVEKISTVTEKLRDVPADKAERASQSSAQFLL